MSAKLKVVVICGPTGIGKTAVSGEIASRLKGEIISADSMQIYRYLDIGTAKPSQNERCRIPHHMIDIIDPDQPFDAALYAKTARELILHHFAPGTIPFVVGGTGLYIKALLYGLFRGQTSDPEIRKELKRLSKHHGTQYLYDQLCTADPTAARKIHPNDAYRIIRALEVHRLTGKTISQYHRQHGFSDHPFEVLKIGLNMERILLYDRINRRVDEMIAAGLAEEVQKLLNKGYSEDLKSMQSIGYRHMVEYIKGKISHEEAVRILKRDTRRYAKRQFTWFRADPEISWYRSDQIDNMIQQIEEFLQNQ
jgi:tRNA dimethylallyltransferase